MIKIYGKLSSYHKKIILLVLLCFTLAANLAWLNPSPESEVYKTTPEIPFFWQYNPDSGVEILSAAYFPEVFKTYKTRMDRPGYPIISKSIGLIVGFFLSPFKELKPLEKAAAGHLVLKIFLFCSFGILAFEILANYLSKSYAFFAVFILLTHQFSISAFSTFHTLELQFITPVFLTYFFILLIRNYSHLRNILLSILIGIFMLSKPNYAFYLGFLFFGFIRGRYAETFISFISHLTPFLAYFLYLKIMGIEFYSLTTEHYGQGIWLFEKLPFVQFQDLLTLIFVSISSFLNNLINHFNILFFISIVGFIHAYRKEVHVSFLLIFILISMTWFQEFAADRYKNYMVADLSLIVVGFSIYYLKELLTNYSKKNLVLTSSIVWLSFNLFSLVNLPWVHPKEQISRNIEVTNQRLDMVENYKNYSDKDRQNAKGGKLIIKEKN